jgi:predicted ATPase
LLTFKRGDHAAGLEVTRRQFEEAGEARFLPRFSLLVGEFAAALGEIGEVAEGLATIEEILTRSTVRHEQWYVSELLRIKGELLLRDGARASVPVAELCFGQSIEMAQRQGALFWELRSALSLARFKASSEKKTNDARDVLERVVQKFTEGFWLPELHEAKALLDLTPRVQMSAADRPLTGT